ncbi:hypothetical protein DM860_014013 [Cuscuta australis]|uniref:Uncharacterized protein n=1 Tax=Cuscuta australis TaxID=267555 RepID=A0A328DRZ0_9ASTE|nr:hypothetical protein DM860_014013 [Cuscuta australis]
MPLSRMERRRGRPKKMMTEANRSTPTTTMTVSPQSDAVNKIDLTAGKQNLTPKTLVEKQDVNYEGGAELEPNLQDKEKSGKATGKQKQLSYVEVVEGVSTFQGCEEWDKALLCCVLGANPPVDVIKGKWSPDCQVNVNELKDVPIWIQFPKLNMRYWSLSCLSKLGSIIRKPIKRDKATAMRPKWGYARIQLEVQVQMGHITEMCRKSNGEGQDKKTKKFWRPKQQSKENGTNEKEEKTPPKEVEIETKTRVPSEVAVHRRSPFPSQSPLLLLRQRSAVSISAADDGSPRRVSVRRLHCQRQSSTAVGLQRRHAERWTSPPLPASSLAVELQCRQSLLIPVELQCRHCTPSSCRSATVAGVRHRRRIQPLPRVDIAGRLISTPD